jgi:hypothetical protein
VAIADTDFAVNACAIKIKDRTIISSRDSIISRGYILFTYFMNTKQTNLAGRLLYLPLDINEKVLLWLAYKGLKPVSEITVERRNMADLRRGIHQNTYNYNSPKIKRIRRWLRDAGMFKAIQPKFNTSWHVGLNKNDVILSAKILRRLDYDSEFQSGIILGYPKESARGYAQNRIAKSEKEKVPMLWPGYKYLDPYLKDKYYTNYVFYAIRKDRVKEDSKIAQTWADTIRKDVPLLAKWFEKKENIQKVKDIKLTLLGR